MMNTCDLTRELSVRIIDVSASGCLIETDRRFEVGTRTVAAAIQTGRVPRRH